MKIKWEIEDGYAGGERPHFLEIDDFELAGYESEKEINEFIEECIQEEFNQIVSFEWEIV